MSLAAPLKKLREKRTIFQKDYMREAYINRFLMISPQTWHPNIVSMKNFYVDKSIKNGNQRLNLVLDYAKFGDISKVNHIFAHIYSILNATTQLI